MDLDFEFHNSRYDFSCDCDASSLKAANVEINNPKF